jgi:TonB family protein
MRLSTDQIGVVKTAEGITTRLVFTGEVQEIVCGDLYDSNTGRGGFVVQKIGNDVFLKPVVSKGLSNLFVKIGEKEGTTFGFDLTIVSVEQAHRVVNVVSPGGNPPPPPPKVTAPEPAKRAAIPPSPRKLELADTIAGQWTDVMFSLPQAPAHLPAPLPHVGVLSQRETRALEQARVQGGIEAATQRVVLNRVVPSYPDIARAARVQGPVTVEVRINDEGKVTQAKVVSGPALLRTAALSAARRWRFAPAIITGAGREEITRIIFKFTGM